ncbi:MAG: 30S ribosomal protein S20 [Candidatus Saccharibacteria bacterium]|nr:30S ribosomal protein S20 [Candidatus Saccharibacteria bacterium]
MPIIQSAKKRVRVARKATVRNFKTKRTMRSAIKDFQGALSSGKKVEEARKTAQSTIDTAAKKGIMHKNKAARKQRQLAAQAKNAKGAKKTASAAKSSTKKTSTAKKPASKKTTTKKTTKK